MIDKLSPNDAKWVADARRQFIERVDGPVITALRARVAKLEAALTKIRDNDPDGWEAAIARAALMHDGPLSRSPD